MTRRALILPTLLALAGVLMLAGCIYIPTFGVSVEGTSNLQKKVGAADSKKPIRLNTSTRSEVEQVFGQPYDAKVDGTQTVYAWTRRWGIAWLPLCFWNRLGYVPDDRTKWFLLTYNSDHVLVKVELLELQPPPLASRPRVESIKAR